MPARVLHVIDSLHLGGAQEVILNIVRGADRTRFAHEVATMHGRGIYHERLMEAGVPVHSLSPHKYLPSYVPRLISLMRGGRFDIVHCHLVAANIIAKPLAAACGIRVIINHDHTNDPARADRTWLLALDTLANRFATHIIAVSASCREFLLTRERIPPSGVSLILNAIDVPHFSPTPGARTTARQKLGIPADVRLVAGVGRLNPQKNFPLFLEIAGRLAHDDPTVRFLIAGTGPEEKRLRSQQAALGLDSRLTFAGYVADPRLVYAACDVLLMPSRFEGLPMTLLEAMAMETPVVASRIDGFAEVIEDGVDGFLVDTMNPDDFAARIRRILSDPASARALGSAAREKVAARFSAERMVAAVEAVYDRFLP